MRTFRIQVNETAYIVSVRQIGKGRFQATVDGVTFEAEATTNDEIATWLVHNTKETLHAAARVVPNDRVDVWVASIPFPATVHAVGIGGYSIAPEAQRQRSIGDQVRALMPGRITSILVKEGESVKEGTPLLILDAMKMQNEIASPLTGKIKAILVQEGATVKKDAVLITID